MLRHIFRTSTVAAAMTILVGHAALAQQTTPSTSPDYRTTDGNQIGSNRDNGSATSGDRSAMSGIKESIERQRQMNQRP